MRPAKESFAECARSGGTGGGYAAWCHAVFEGSLPQRGKAHVSRNLFRRIQQTFSIDGQGVCPALRFRVTAARSAEERLRESRHEAAVVRFLQNAERTAAALTGARGGRTVFMLQERARICAATREP